MWNNEPTIDIEQQAMEIFPSLKPLLQFDTSEVAFKFKGREYIVLSIDGEDPQNPTVKNICLGIWEVVDDKRIPVGYCDAWFNRIDKVVTLDLMRHQYFVTNQEFLSIDDIEYSDWEIKNDLVGADAFAIDVKYRRTGLADIFQAQALAVFQGLGAVEVSYVGDMTTHSEEEEGFVPQFKTEGRIIKEQPETSFYSKWLASHEIRRENKSHYTRIKPVLSGMQISMLKEVGL